MMRQAGRYMKEYRDLAVKYPSFRERSETTDLITEITLQPWRAFQPDGVILFSDILTPLPALGIPFEIDDYKGPILDQPIRDAEGLKMMHELDLDMLPFVGEALSILRDEVGDTAAVLGFVGAPWTLATYIVEGGSSSTYKTIKSMAMQNPEVLQGILGKVADPWATTWGTRSMPARSASRSSTLGGVSCPRTCGRSGASPTFSRWWTRCAPPTRACP